MDDYFSRFLNLGWQLRQYLTELIENWLRSIDWIPQRLGVQFSASHGGSLTGTIGYFHEGAFALSVGYTTTEEQTTNGTSEGTIFRKGLSSIYERSYVRSSYLLHGFRLVRRLAFSVRDQWNLFSSEVHGKLTRLSSFLFFMRLMRAGNRKERLALSKQKERPSCVWCGSSVVAPPAACTSSGVATAMWKGYSAGDPRIL